MAFQDAAKGRNHAHSDVMEGRAPRQRHDSGDLAIRIARDGELSEPIAYDDFAGALRAALTTHQADGDGKAAHA